MPDPITRRSGHRAPGETNQDALARLAGERDAALRDVAALRALFPPAGLPDVLATVDDVRAVCIERGLTEHVNDYEDPVWGVAADDDWFVQSEAGPDGVHFSSVTVYRRGTDDEVAVVYGGAPSRLLRDAIDAARGGGPRG